MYAVNCGLYVYFMYRDNRIRYQTISDKFTILACLIDPFQDNFFVFCEE